MSGRRRGAHHISGAAKKTKLAAAKHEVQHRPQRDDDEGDVERSGGSPGFAGVNDQDDADNGSGFFMQDAPPDVDDDAGSVRNISISQPPY